MLLLAASLTTAHAGDVYINGVQASGLTNFELSGVDVKIDASGDVYIDAPRYSIEIISTDPEPEPEAEPEPEPAPGPEEAAPQDSAPAPDAAPVVTTELPPQAVAPESWWLVSQDNGSTGHVVDVFVGGQPVATVTSGDAQLLLDISAYLAPGENVINFNARPGQPGGGLLELHVGAGQNVDGTLELDPPSITFSRRASDDVAGTAEQHSLDVP